jgi:hypothetical protein
MSGALFLLLILGLPIASAIAVVLRVRSKRAARDRFVAALGPRLAAIGAEGFDDGHFRYGGRAFRFAADINPLFSSSFDLRLSTFCDSVLEFEIRRARNVPAALPEALRSDALFRGCALDAPSAEEPARYLAAMRDKLAGSFPRRWAAFSKMHCELVLSANRFAPEAWDGAEARGDLEALAAMASVPAWREPKGGTWTYRTGFERHIAEWHWKADQRARLPEGARRWLVSAWVDNAYLNRPLIRFFRKLAGPVRPCGFTLARASDFSRTGSENPPTCAATWSRSIPPRWPSRRTNIWMASSSRAYWCRRRRRRRPCGNGTPPKRGSGSTMRRSISFRA